MINQLEDLLETFPCDLCDQWNEEFLFTKQGILTNYPFIVVRCRSCGLIYLNPRLSEQALLELYDKNYYYGKGFDTNVNYISDFDKDSDTEKLFRPEVRIKIIKDIIPPPSTVLDFGCGLGDFMRQASKYNYIVEGFEVSHFAAAFARTKGFKVYDSLDQLPHERYDLVTAIEVLEHCSSPMKALSAIYQCLKPGGVLYYTTENFDDFYGKWKLGKKNLSYNYIVPEGHIHFFSTNVMNAYFKKIGYSKTFYFESKSLKDGPLFEIITKLGLGTTLNTFSGRLLYQGARNIATILGLRKRPLPLIKK